VHAHPSRNARVPSLARVIAPSLGLALCLCLVPLPGCGGDDESGGISTGPCGDGVCDATTQCESPVRCAEDCGTCVGSQCTASGTKGSCGQPCRNSCECAHGEEVCTADFGEADGTCVSVDCLDCNSLAQCQFAPDADGRCATVTCG